MRIIFKIYIHIDIAKNRSSRAVYIFSIWKTTPEKIRSRSANCIFYCISENPRYQNSEQEACGNGERKSKGNHFLFYIYFKFTCLIKYVRSLSWLFLWRKLITQYGMMQVIDIPPTKIDKENNGHRQQNCIYLFMQKRRDQKIQQ